MCNDTWIDHNLLNNSSDFGYLKLFSLLNDIMMNLFVHKSLSDIPFPTDRMARSEIIGSDNAFLKTSSR